MEKIPTGNPIPAISSYGISTPIPARNFVEMGNEMGSQEVIPSLWTSLVFYACVNSHTENPQTKQLLKVHNFVTSKTSQLLGSLGQRIDK